MRIPVPLNALRAFEAAARHLSIKDAALELAVTPSAVSHQLRTLEDLLGVELLRRVGATVELTDAGRRLAPTLNAGFCHIAASVQALRDERLDGPLRLHTLPAIAINWLAPRLAAYPFGTAESALDITTVQGHADLAAGTADVGLWFGEPPWPGLLSEMLFAGTLGVYARAGSLAATPEGRLAQLAQAHLFVSRYGLHWEQWLQTLPAGPQHPALMTQVDSCGLALQAASEGTGLCLVVAQLAERSVRAGLLEPLFDHEVPAGGDFHLVYPPALGEDRRLDALRAWLREHSPPENGGRDSGDRGPARTMRMLYTLAYPVLSEHDGHWIEAFRHEYDPQFAVVDAHFTMAFGCTDVSQDVYMSHVEAASDLAHRIRFTCRYAMLGADHRSDSACVFLVPDEGYSDLSRLHDHLYRGVLAEHLRLDVPFIPHITIGACSDRRLAKRLCDDLNAHGMEVGGLIDTLTVATVDDGKVRELGAFDLAAG